MMEQKTGGCSYCFVDDFLNDGVVATGKAYLSREDTIDSMLAARGRISSMNGL